MKSSPARSGGRSDSGFRKSTGCRAGSSGVRLADFNYMHPDLPVHHQEQEGDGQLVSLFGENLSTPEQAQWLAAAATAFVMRRAK